MSVNSLRQIFRLPKFKAFADDKSNVAEKLKYVWGSVENIVGKGGNSGFQHFLLFPQCFQKASFSGLLKVGIVWKRDNTSNAETSVHLS